MLFSSSPHVLRACLRGSAPWGRSAWDWGGGKLRVAAGSTASVSLFFFVVNSCCSKDHESLYDMPCGPASCRHGCREVGFDREAT